MKPFDVVIRRPEHLLLAGEHLFVSVHMGPTTLASVAAESHHARTKLGRTPRSVGCLVVLAEDVPPPPPEVRSALPRLLDEIAPVCAGLAMVIEGAGFRIAALRAVFSGFLAIKRLPYRTAVFSRSAEGFDWLAQAVEIDPKGCERELQTLRAPR